MLENLPELMFPGATTESGEVGAESQGKWHFGDKWGDGHMVHVEGVGFVLCYNGAQFMNEGMLNINTSQMPDTGWLPVWGGIATNNAPIGIAEVGWGAENADNIDTWNLLYSDPAIGGSGLWTAVLSNKPGTRPTGGGETGYVASVQRVTCGTKASPNALSQKPEFWLKYAGEHIIEADETNAPWTWPTPTGLDYKGGTLENTVVLVPGGTVLHPGEPVVVIFFVGQSANNPANWHGETQRWRIGRAECPLAKWDNDFAGGDGPSVHTDWTPAKSPTSYVFTPDEQSKNGGVPVIENDDGANWGTAQWVLQPDVSIDPDGIMHMMLINTLPSIFGETRGDNVGLGHYTSSDQGFTWVADAGNPVVTFADMGWLPPSQGPPGRPGYLIVNKLGSPFLVWRGLSSWLFFWGNDADLYQAGTELYGIPIMVPSIRRQILDALATRFDLAGWHSIVRTNLDPATPPAGTTKRAYIIDRGEVPADSPYDLWQSRELDIVVEVGVLVEEAGGNPRDLLDSALVELQQVVHAAPADLGVVGCDVVRQTGVTFNDPDDRNVVVAEWRLTASYRHDYENPDVFTPSFGAVTS